MIANADVGLPPLPMTDATVTDPLPPGAIAEARAALAAHLADPRRAAAEVGLARAIGVEPLICLGGLLFFATGAVCALLGARQVHGSVFLAPLVLLPLLWVIGRWRGDPRRSGHARRDPAATLRCLLNALGDGPAAVALGCLSPSARASEAAPAPWWRRHLDAASRTLRPRLGRALTDAVLRQPAQGRLAASDGEVAWVAYTLRSRPQWPWHLVVGAAVCAVGCLITAHCEEPMADLAICLATLVLAIAGARWTYCWMVRRPPRRHCHKALIRGGNGLWYVVDAQRADDGVPLLA